MTALARAELLKLTSVRSFWMLALGTVGFAALAALLAVGSAGRHQRASAGTTGAVLDVTGGFGRGSVVMLALGALMATTEYRFGTISATLLHTPQRHRLALAKALVVLAVAAAIGAVCLIAAAAVGRAGHAITAEVLNVAVVRRCLGLLLAYPLYGLAGVGAGLLVPRLQAVALVVPAAWVLVLEDLVLGSIGRTVPAWSFSRVTAAAASAPNVPGLWPVWAGALALIIYSLITWACGAARLARSDIA